MKFPSGTKVTVLPQLQSLDDLSVGDPVFVRCGSPISDAGVLRVAVYEGVHLIDGKRSAGFQMLSGDAAEAAARKASFVIGHWRAT